MIGALLLSLTLGVGEARPVAWAGTRDAVALDAALLDSTFAEVWRLLGGGGLAAAQASQVSTPAWLRSSVRSPGQAVPMETSMQLLGAERFAGAEPWDEATAPEVLRGNVDLAALFVDVRALYSEVARSRDGRDAASRLGRWGVLGFKQVRGGVTAQGKGLAVRLAVDDQGAREGVLGALGGARPMPQLAKAPPSLGMLLRVVVQPAAMIGALSKLWSYDSAVTYSLFRAQLDNSEVRAGKRFVDGLGGDTDMIWSLVGKKNEMPVAALDVADGLGLLEVARAFVVTLPSIDPATRVEFRGSGDRVLLVAKRQGVERLAVLFTPRRLWLGSGATAVDRAPAAFQTVLTEEAGPAAVATFWQHDSATVPAMLAQASAGPLRPVFEALLPKLSDATGRARAVERAKKLSTASRFSLARRDGGWSLEGTLGLK